MPLYTRSDPSKGGVSSILIAGLVIIGVCVAALAAGGIYYWIKHRRPQNSEARAEDGSPHDVEKAAPRTGFSRANINSTIILPAPARSNAQESNHTMQNRRPMTEGEAAIADHHQANNELPAAFTAFVVSDLSDEAHNEPRHIVNPAELSAIFHGSDRSTHQNTPSTSTTYTLTVSIGRTGEYRSSRASFASTVPSPLSPSFSRQQTSDISSTVATSGQQITTEQIATGPSSFLPLDRSKNITASRPGSNSTTSNTHTFGSPDRTSFSSFKFPAVRYLGHRSSVASIASSHSAMIFAKNALSAMRKKALQQFEPLLPDEIPVSVGDTLSLLQQFDDGWCVCAVEVDGESEGGVSVGGRAATPNKEVRMGCVPLWVFERKSKVPGEHMRSMRSTSLAVTVELTPAEAGMDLPGRAPWQREPIISWSNF